MRLTPALAIRNLIAKIHPPLPQTPRESQKLLSVLQSSFNRRLDDAHPSPQVPVSLRNTGATERLPDVGNVSAGAANAHLQAILNHPSLEQAVSPCLTPPVKIAELFDAAVLAQSVNFSLIRNCVELSKRCSSSERAAAALALGPRIATWFTTADKTTQKAFLEDPGLMSHIIPVMYSANLEGTVWDWLRTLYESFEIQQQASDLEAEDRFVAFMTRESIKVHDLRAAVVEYSEACEYRASRLLKETTVGANENHPLLISGNLISSAILLRRHRHGIPESLYDRLLSHASTKAIELRTVLWPFLHLYHPSHAQSRPLYQALQDDQYTVALMLKVNGMKRDRASKILISILDGAELMLEHGPRSKAQFMLNFAQQHFPTMLPEQRSSDFTEIIHQARRYIATHKHASTSLAPT